MASDSAKNLTSLPVFAPSLPPEGPRTVVCFGMARGGTSMIAGAIMGLGVPMGERLTDNLEDDAFKPDRFGDRQTEFLRQARLTIAQRNEAHEVWGWKFPMAQRYLDRLVDELRAPHLVCVHRDPVPWLLRMTPAAGKEASFMAGRLNWEMQNAMLIDRLKLPCLMVSYEKAATHPEVFLEELGAFLGLPVPEYRAEIVAFMRPGSYKDPSALMARIWPPAGPAD